MRAAIVALALSAFSLAWAEEPVAPPAPAARIEAAARAYDAGKVDHGSKVRHSFLLKNVGAAELKVDAKPG